ncbi:MAG: hypothetical protein ABI442_19895 [Gemmatimonadaceae bacterium]
MTLGGATTKLASSAAGKSVWRPRFSYDGAFVYYSAGEYPQPLDVFRVAADGSSGVPVQASPVGLPGRNRNWSGSPSPDGTLLTFIEAGGVLHVYSMVTKVDWRSTVAADAPRFSPDGTWISFIDPSSLTLRIMHPDGTGLRQITADGLAAFGMHDWSPGGA